MHKVDIPQEIIDACIRFRGRRYAFEHIEPQRTALGFLNIMVSDAMATRTDVEHNATLVNVMQLVADVRTTEDVIALLRDAGA